MMSQLEALDKELQSMDTSDMYTKAMAAGFYWHKKYIELRDKVKSMPRFTFLSPKEGGVKRYLNKSGNWIERHDLVEHIENTIEFSPDSDITETIRTQQAEIDRLTEQRDRLLKALGDLSFECFGGGIGTCQPSVKTYNDTFAVLDEIRKGIT